jgi:hypothetical protein
MAAGGDFRMAAVIDDSANFTRSPQVLVAPSGESENATWQKRPLRLR